MEEVIKKLMFDKTACTATAEMRGEGEVQVYFDDGTRKELTFDEWFELLDFSCRIIKINDDMCAELDQGKD